ncbi:MAG TPA: SDR family oxidoreductase [Armatimonadaceae bacterium]|nr:SDR family oxidoreductase [Armatimonadaceae bacterium]
MPIPEPVKKVLRPLKHFVQQRPHALRGAGAARPTDELRSILRPLGADGEEGRYGMVIDLSGHLAVVTGASGELGRTIARTLAGCGAGVVVHYHRGEARAEAVAADIRAAGGRTMTAQADITDAASIAAMKAAVERELGATPDILVNNAVAQYPWKSVLEQPAEDFDSQYRSCVLQNVLMAQAFVPAMTEKGWGRVIAISTECAMQCHPGQAAYVSGKRGMDGVLRVLAKEVGARGVTVNQVAPGWMISDKAREAGTERQEGYEKNVPLRRRGDDQDIANAVAFLASDLADFVTGVYLPVCGGNVMPTI